MYETNEDFVWFMGCVFFVMVIVAIIVEHFIEKYTKDD